MSEAINGSSRQRVALSAPFQPQGIMERTRYDHGAAASFPFVIRYARRHLGFLAGLVVTAIAVGVVYRYSFDQLEERTLSYYLRSCLHAIGLALSGWAVLLSFSAPQAQHVATIAANRRTGDQGARNDSGADDRRRRPPTRALPRNVFFARLVSPSSPVDRRDIVFRITSDRGDL